MVCVIDKDAVREAYNERAAIIEHDAGKPRKVAEAMALSLMRVYHVVVWLDDDCQREQRHMTVIAPGEQLEQVRRDLGLKFGRRLVSVEPVKRSDVVTIAKGGS